MVHLSPVPGTPFYPGNTIPSGRISLAAELDRLKACVEALVVGGADGVLLQTSDRVYSTEDTADPATVATVAVLTRAVRELAPADFGVGVQIMRNAASAALAIAKVVDADFVRISAIIGSSLSAHGWVHADPLAVMRYRRALDAFDIELMADVDTVHYQWAGAAEPVSDLARRAIGAGADSVCIGHPDERRTAETLRAVRDREPAIRLVLAGHSTFDNAPRLLPLVDAVCVSRCLSGSDWTGTIQPDLVRRYVDLAVAAAR